MIGQKHLVLFHAGERYNFFFTPGSMGGLSKHLDDGWIVKDIRDAGGMTSVLLERSNK